MSAISLDQLRAAVRNIPDFPQSGIQFKDITPVLGDAVLFSALIDHVAAPYRPGDVDVVVGIDARGFILAAATAYRLQAAFAPVRKKGKLPYQTLEQSYDLEYGSNTVAMHADAIRTGQRILLVDDLLATGGTAGASASLIERLGGRIIEAVFFIELAFLNGRSKLQGFPVRTLVAF
ncbi:MAG TPA: adenine phosphoribosyltransferase [Candidatus Paceibacterota bacterium]|nr:adenine phosphoribosyltransferase [Verrucomicrobiota bacterium]HRY48275.1 adenine phosphoribosyltransferase [Candidatus Paceibacterota bacterium]HSA03508.1 adenine phosphoribosyltransferase [Candidatus Paceibacterota bacterium]